MAQPAPRPNPETSRRRPLRRLFGDLRIRPKLIVLHNVFFLVLTVSVYFSLIPLIENQIGSFADARDGAGARDVRRGKTLA